jgi:hypothetical protein
MDGFYYIIEDFFEPKSDVVLTYRIGTIHNKY